VIVPAPKSLLPESCLGQEHILVLIMYEIMKTFTNNSDVAIIHKAKEMIKGKQYQQGGFVCVWT
jgi:hypothetical protein